MSRTLYLYILRGAIALISASFLFLIFLSFEAITETEDWKPFDIDFSGKHNVISSFGGILAALLSFITILFIILDIAYQRRSKTEIEEAQEFERRQTLLDRLFETQLFIQEVLTTLGSQKESFEDYISKAREAPSLMRVCNFYPTTFSKFLLQSDRILIYQAFKHYQPGEEWQKSYINLFKIVDFYDQLIPEMRDKYSKHTHDLVRIKREVNQAFEVFADSLNDKRNSFIMSRRTEELDEYETLQYGLLSKFSKEINEYNQSQVVGEARDSDLELLSAEVIKPFLDEILTMFNFPFMTSDPHKIYDLLALGIRVNRLIEDLQVRSMNFIVDLEKYKENYFQSNSDYILKLQEIHDLLNKAHENDD